MKDTASLDQRLDRLDRAIDALERRVDRERKVERKRPRHTIDAGAVFSRKPPQQIGAEFERQLRRYHRKHFAEVHLFPNERE